jgi:protein-tyrosine phosphatase
MASRFRFSAGRASEGQAPGTQRRSGFSFGRALQPASGLPDDGPLPRRDTVLFVCTGNVCRSAYGHHVFQALLAQRPGLGLGGLQVASAGTGINQALQPPAQILRLAAARCPEAVGALTAHRPTALDEAALARAVVVLAATDRHLDVVLDEQPSAARRCFTMLEFARLCGHVLEEGLAEGCGVEELVRRCADLRERQGGRAEDLADPFGRSDAEYEAMAEQLQPAVEWMVEAVARALGGS